MDGSRGGTLRLPPRNPKNPMTTREKGEVMSWTMLIAFVALAVTFAEAPTAFAQDRLNDWRGRPSIEFTRPTAEQSSTMRVIRSNGSIDDTLDDQETAVGWSKAAAEGKVKPREEQTEPEGTIEIIQRKDAQKAVQK